MFWFLGMAMVLFLLAMSTYEFEPVVGILATSYFLGLGFLAMRWFIRQVRGLLTLRKEKTTAELLHLRSQVNPHFFFNMLNNLYGTVGQDSDKAQQLILKLSDLMRYGIYEGQKETVSLMSEINYLENYVALHRLRYHKQIDVDFRHELADENRQVMPLLFIILLENAFKHGVENLRKDAFVSVRMWTSPDTIHFRVKNNFDVEARNETPGIGLQNLKRRLALAYPDRHIYRIDETEDTYTAELTLKAT
ncbi:histidine kinase [Lewinella sp. W8]|uniref:sensor histidine kinase n=1 Tax=Lewinella sp. W8 TaxID=2528208 RepID=UPI001C12B062